MKTSNRKRHCTFFNGICCERSQLPAAVQACSDHTPPKTATEAFCQNWVLQHWAAPTLLLVISARLIPVHSLEDSCSPIQNSTSFSWRAAYDYTICRLLSSWHLPICRRPRISTGICLWENEPRNNFILSQHSYNYPLCITWLPMAVFFDFTSILPSHPGPCSTLATLYSHLQVHLPLISKYRGFNAWIS